MNNKKSSVIKMLQGTVVQDEWYTPEYAVKPLLPYLKPESVILCPFDKKDSSFVKVFRNAGHYVNFGHIDDGNDFFDTPHGIIDGSDYIISNPPYSKKDQVFEYLFKLGKPFAMLMGVVGIMEGKRFDLFANKEIEIMWLKPRIHFLDRDGNPKGQPPFQNCYVCHKVLPEKHIFTRMERNEKKI